MTTEQFILSSPPPPKWSVRCLLMVGHLLQQSTMSLSHALSTWQILDLHDCMSTMISAPFLNLGGCPCCGEEPTPNKVMTAARWVCVVIVRSRCLLSCAILFGCNPLVSTHVWNLARRFAPKPRIPAHCICNHHSVVPHCLSNDGHIQGRCRAQVQRLLDQILLSEQSYAPSKSVGVRLMKHFRCQNEL
jgi:hypothetical protein